jgi:hypothetical protein
MRVLEMRARARRARVARIERYAHYTVDTPPSGAFHARPFAIWLMIGMPVELATSVCDSDNAGPVRVLHAPSDRDVKGTVEIRAAVQRLKTRGVSLELVEVSGRTNDAVQRALAECDMVIDQLYSDSPMAMLAAEAAAHGKAVIVAGCYSTRVRKDLPEAAVPPTLYCSPENIEDAIESLALDRSRRRALAASAHDYVAGRFRPEIVAKIYLRLLRGELGAEYFYDPIATLRDVAPMGMPAAAAQHLVAQLIRERGEAALQLGHNPALLAGTLRFAAVQPC